MIWNPFLQHEQLSLGIDIGTASIKAVQLLRKGNIQTLKNYGEINLTQIGEETAGLKIIESQIAASIRDLLSYSRMPARQAAFSVPTFSSFSTIVRLPAMPQGELERAVRFEARRSIPIPLADVHFEWIKLKHLSNNRVFKVMVVAVPSEVIARYYRIAKSAGLQITHLELETFSAARALGVLEEARSALVLDIGTRSSGLSIVENSVAAFHRNIDTAGISFTRVLSRALSISAERAEGLKREHGLTDRETGKVLTPLVDKIVTEIEKSIKEYMAEGGSRPVRIIAHGGSVLMAGLLPYIQENTNIPVELGNAFGRMETPPELTDYLAKNAPQFAVASGLALH
ncbi:MAG: hypothetical protein A2932_00490 [Candidatus Spechtbacteria bacterium RIFCSPLOWO2_01_FULL_46_10]|uniref:SHS2 domain-containing protein n=1 Tax=Candidatus Spechtbacteria bacterium RIFCSPLOWO2_01_FULL_46_10 TaxID=1802163 RepID=A0A1G2HGV5_9BACT|nr:MAG: hypothetical protein A2932_00490 [Candidatus Spechtbacteria bacterium RIFCSPLOWO2_01_FULL_46_10]